MDNTIRPAGKEEKLWIRAEQAREFGKEFDEAKERRVIGLPPVEGREPLFYPANAEREKLIRMEDREGIRELQREAQRVQDGDLRQQNQLQNAEIERLKRQVAELSGKSVEPEPEPAAVPPPTTEPESTLPLDGEDYPNEKWSPKSINDWLESRELPLPPRKGVGISKLAILEHVATVAPKEGETAPELTTVGRGDA